MAAAEAINASAPARPREPEWGMRMARPYVGGAPVGNWEPSHLHHAVTRSSRGDDYIGCLMGGMTTRFRSLWALGLGLPLAAGIAAFAVEELIKPGHACTTGNPSHGGLYFVIYIALVLAPIAIVGLVGWRSGRPGEETVGPFVITVVLTVCLVFAGLLAGWHGAGCIT